MPAKTPKTRQDENRRDLTNLIVLRRLAKVTTRQQAAAMGTPQPYLCAVETGRNNAAAGFVLRYRAALETIINAVKRVTS